MLGFQREEKSLGGPSTAMLQDAPGRLYESTVGQGNPFSISVNLISPFGSSDTPYLLEMRWAWHCDGSAIHGAWHSVACT